MSSKRKGSPAGILGAVEAEVAASRKAKAGRTPGHQDTNKAGEVRMTLRLSRDVYALLEAEAVRRRARGGAGPRPRDASLRALIEEAVRARYERR